MAGKIGKREDTRARIVASAGRLFRRRGYGGAGVDGLAKEAGVTSGAFYANFKSKTAAFREAVVAGMRDLRAGITHFRQADPSRWRQALIDFYLTERTTCDIGESCALQNLTVDVARADDDVRLAYEDELRGVIAAATDGGGSGPGARRELIALLSVLTGGVSMARAVQDPALRAEILAAVRTAAEAMVAAP
jgi:AcrR family transcriptional regulator